MSFAMYLKYFSFIFTLSFCSSLFAAPNDLFIDYEVPISIRQKFFNEVIDKAVPGKMVPDRYHVSLMNVKNIKQNPHHFNALRSRLRNLRDQSLANVHFTPISTFQFRPPLGPIAIESTIVEKQQFKQMNSLLYTEVMNFNLQHNTAYKIEEIYYNPNNYTPHLTIEMRPNNASNAQQIMQTVNLKLAIYTRLNGAPLDLMQVAQPIRAPQVPVPQVKKPAPQVTKPKITAQRPAAHLNRRVAAKLRPAANVNRMAAVRQKPAANVNRRVAAKQRLAAQLNRRVAAKQRPAVNIKRRVAVRQKPAANVNRRVAAKQRLAAQLNRRVAAKQRPAVNIKRRVAVRQKPAANFNRRVAVRQKPALQRRRHR